MNTGSPSRKNKIEFLQSIAGGNSEISQLNVKTYTWLLSNHMYRCDEYQVPIEVFHEFTESIGGNHIIIRFSRQNLDFVPNSDP